MLGTKVYPLDRRFGFKWKESVLQKSNLNVWAAWESIHLFCFHFIFHVIFTCLTKSPIPNLHLLPVSRPYSEKQTTWVTAAMLHRIKGMMRERAESKILVRLNLSPGHPAAYNSSMGPRPPTNGSLSLAYKGSLLIHLSLPCHLHLWPNSLFFSCL